MRSSYVLLETLNDELNSYRAVTSQANWQAAVFASPQTPREKFDDDAGDNNNLERDSDDNKLEKDSDDARGFELKTDWFALMEHWMKNEVNPRKVKDLLTLSGAEDRANHVRELAVAKVALREGRFRSTLGNAQQLLPQESLHAFCELVTPLDWERDDQEIPHGATDRPLVGTCYAGIWRQILDPTGSNVEMWSSAAAGDRRARVLASQDVDRDPTREARSCDPGMMQKKNLSCYADLPILGQATIEEAKSLLEHFRDCHNFSQLVVAGSSMGGLHAAMVASVFPGDVGATAWLAPPSAVPVFADGLLSGSCNWRSLYKQHELQLLDKMLAGYAVAESYEKLANADADAEKEQAAVPNSDVDPVQEAKKRMRLFLSITDIDNFLPPRRSDAVVFVYGTEDEYIGFTEPQWAVR
ncbi:unnamed protein product [Phytophthora lilii]|uniref:Unnamed protein product n=1 Tax=Phytophthora lilii TaxID=2077276 RepID=A0A9W6U7M4_9STRA|nr:unnamed protein product [Phytophthora lilii]